MFSYDGVNILSGNNILNNKNFTVNDENNKLDNTTIAKLKNLCNVCGLNSNQNIAINNIDHILMSLGSCIKYRSTVDNIVTYENLDIICKFIFVDVIYNNIISIKNNKIIEPVLDKNNIKSVFFNNTFINDETLSYFMIILDYIASEIFDISINYATKQYQKHNNQRKIIKDRIYTDDERELFINYLYITENDIYDALALDNDLQYTLQLVHNNYINYNLINNYNNNNNYDDNNNNYDDNNYDNNNNYNDNNNNYDDNYHYDDEFVNSIKNLNLNNDCNYDNVSNSYDYEYYDFKSNYNEISNTINKNNTSKSESPNNFIEKKSLKNKKICQGKSKKGINCKRLANKHSDFCHSHQESC